MSNGDSGQNPLSSDATNQNTNLSNQPGGIPTAQSPSTGDASQEQQASPPQQQQPAPQPAGDASALTPPSSTPAPTDGSQAVVPAPDGGGGNNPPPDNSGQPPPPNPPPPQLDDASSGNTLLTDKTFQALHDAFLLGWNLLELRSRILLAALDVSFQKADNQVGAFDLVDAVMDKLLPEAVDKDADEGIGNTPDTDATANPDSDSQAVMSSARPGLLGGDPFEKLPIEPSDAVWTTSVWRAMFNRIVGLQIKLVATNDTTGTIYEVDIPTSNNLPYAYLYIPKLDTDTFTSIGISSSDSATYAIPSSFELYNITRRTLNCLTQLYVRPNEVLNSDKIAANRDKIVPAILSAAPGIAPQGTGASSPEDVQVAIKRYTGLTVRFLEAWDGYVRESFYVGQNFENYEIGMVAYEAGRALCTLSWGVALFVVPLENALKDLKDDGSDAFKAEKKLLMQKLYSAWQSVFNARDIIHIQHQISGMSNAMDGAYYRLKLVSIQNQPTDQTYSPLNPNLDDDCLPSNSLRTINKSLDYWQAAINWMGGPRAQQNIYTTHGLTYDADVPVMSRELSRHLRVALIEQADVWQSLITGRQTLRSITTETVTEAILSQFMEECEQAFMADVTQGVADAAEREQQQAEAEAKELFRRNRLLFIVLGSLAAIVLISLIGIEFLTFFPNSATANTPLGNAIITLASILGVGFVVHRTTQASSQTPATGNQGTPGQPVAQSSGINAAVHSANMLDGIRSFFVISGGEIGELFSACRREIQKQYTDLNHNASVSYPLIEVFVLNSQPPSPVKRQNIKPPLYDFGVNDSYSFLTSVIWTHEVQEAEIQSIVRATFGPLSEMIGAYGARFRHQDGGGDGGQGGQQHG